MELYEYNSEELLERYGELVIKKNNLLWHEVTTIECIETENNICKVREEILRRMESKHDQQRLQLEPSESPYQRDMVGLPKEQYDELVDRSKLVEALFDAGLEDWDGYDTALEIKNGL